MTTQPHPQIVLENQAPSWKQWSPAFQAATLAALAVVATPTIAGAENFTNGDCFTIETTPQLARAASIEDARDEQAELEAILAAEAEELAFLARHRAGLEEAYEQQRESREFSRE